jgi:hypothetical protein
LTRGGIRGEPWRGGASSFAKGEKGKALSKQVLPVRPQPQITETAEDPVLARRVAVLSTAYVLRALRGLARVYGDGQLGVVAYTIFAANTAHLDVVKGDTRIVGPDGVLHDEERRPVSVLKLSKLLGMPFETTRTYVNRLIEAGVCVRVQGGVIVPQASMQRQEASRAVAVNLAVVRKLVEDLQAVGLDVPTRPGNRRRKPPLPLQ